jgi:hypothetical protein
VCSSVLIKKSASLAATSMRQIQLTHRPLLTAWTATIFFALALFVAAGTFSVPQDDPIAKVRLPKKWKTNIHPEFVEAVAPDGATHLMVLPVEGSKVAESIGEALRYIRGTGAILIKPDSMKDENTTVKGRHSRRLSWDATSNDRAVRIHCHVVPVADDKQLLIIFWGSLEAEKKYRRELDEIFETLQAAGD